ncbi:MAG: hypothetical protein MJ137_07705 [Clostridia bacterium]|nr:hypothetical protein [Clostridia bacterium]
MKKNKLLLIIISAVLILSTLVSCTGNGPDITSGSDSGTVSPESGNADTASPPESSVNTAPITTVPSPVTTAPTVPETVISEKAVKYGAGELGFAPVYAKVTDGESVWVMTEKEETLVSPIKPGTSLITFYNSYGETASAAVTVAADNGVSAEFVKYMAPERTFNVVDFGAVPNVNRDSTSSINDAIAAASEAGGGTVYVPKGSYKINSIRMRGGVRLMLEGYLPDATVGYTPEIAKYVTGGKAAVFSTSGSSTNNIFVYNTVLPKSYCTTGESDFSFSGGVILCQAKMKFAAIACGSNIIFENIIIKDTPNNHSFQIDGCENLTIRNIMFAGYDYPASNPVLTRETIQLEATTPGAITSNTETSPIQCASGDYHTNKNITISGCYFGKSDNYGPHLVAVGHHSSQGAVSTEGLLFNGNVIDNPLYCGIHLPNVSDAVITGNTFISEKKYAGGKLGDDSALISLYGFGGDSSYTDSNGKKIMYAFSYEQNGIRNIYIENNIFRLGGGTYLLAMSVLGNSVDNKLNAVYTSNTGFYRVGEFGGEPFPCKVFTVRTNTAYNINVKNNNIDISSKLSQTAQYIVLKNINGFFWSDNNVNIADGIKFSSSSDFGSGISVTTRTVLSDKTAMLTRKVGLDPHAPCTVTVTDGKSSFVMPNPAVACSFTIEPTEGGRVELTTDSRGNLTVSLIADSGYEFEGFQIIQDGTPFDLNQKLSAFTQLKAVFKSN